MKEYTTYSFAIEVYRGAALSLNQPLVNFLQPYLIVYER